MGGNRVPRKKKRKWRKTSLRKKGARSVVNTRNGKLWFLSLPEEKKGAKGGRRACRKEGDQEEERSLKGTALTPEGSFLLGKRPRKQEKHEEEEELEGGL